MINDQELITASARRSTSRSTDVRAAYRPPAAAAVGRRCPGGVRAAGRGHYRAECPEGAPAKLMVSPRPTACGHQHRERKRDCQRSCSASTLSSHDRIHIRRVSNMEGTLQNVIRDGHQRCHARRPRATMLRLDPLGVGTAARAGTRSVRPQPTAIARGARRSQPSPPLGSRSAPHSFGHSVPTRRASCSPRCSGTKGWRFPTLYRPRRRR